MLIISTNKNALRRIKSTASILIITWAFSHMVCAGSEQIFDSGNKQTTLVELYTSQGCSSCPPAERWLGSFRDNPRLWKDVIPVAFHVDYWDYIGWRDTFAKPEYSRRQRLYLAENGIRSVYTPGLVVNGQEWRGWLRKQPLPHSDTVAGQLQVALYDNQLKATYTTSQSFDQALVLHIAVLGVALNVNVKRGENSGQRLSQEFAVLHLIKHTSADLHWTVTLPDIKLPGDAYPAIAIWVSETGSQKPLQATGGWLVR